MASAFSLQSRREAGILSDTAYWKGTRDCLYLIQRLKKTRTLVGHQGCVNTIAWNNSGSRLVSGADDRHLKIYDANLGLELHSVLTTHQSNIFSARFLPADTSSDIRLVSCAGMGSVEYSEVTPVGQYVSHPFQCNRSITYQVAVTPGDSNEFMTCEEKGYVRLYDLRVKSECLCDGCKKDVLYSFPAAVSSMAVHPISPYYLVVGLGDGSIQLLDRRMNSNRKPLLPLSSSSSPSPPPPPPSHRKYSIGNHARKITSVQFNQNGSQLLASYSEDYVYLFNSRLFGCGANSGRGGGDGSQKIIRPTYFARCECQSPAVPRKRKSRVERATSRSSSSSSSPCPHHSAKTDAKSKELPVMKKLRLRGDWSDTGPEAQPEGSSGSQGRNLMSHMSRMFAQWIDMSLSSDEQGQQGEGGGGGGPLGPGLNRARRRINERRRRQQREGRGEETREVGSERLNSSSSSSDNSFNLFDDQEMEMEASSESQSASSNSATSLQQSGVEGVGSNSTASLNQSVVESAHSASAVSLSQSGCSVESNREDSERISSDERQIPAQSSGECTVNLPTADTPSCDQGCATPTEDAPLCNLAGVNSASASYVSNGVNRDTPTAEKPSCDSGGVKSHIEQPHHRASDGMSLNSSDTASLDKPAAECSGPRTVSPLRVEDRSIGHGAGPIPSININIIEDETDSDDVSCDDKDKSCDTRSHDPCDCTLKHSDYEEEGGAGFNDPGGTDKDFIKPFMVYKGHRNARTMIKQANFFGERWVLSGSDCGRVFVWDKWTGQVVNMLLADSHVVNCIQPHPHAYMIATSGIDYNVKLWEPVDKEVCSLMDLQKVITRNQAMLEESRNTITMPSMIFLRVLSYLNRTRRRMQGEEDSDHGEDADS